jgi:hypothetical protein
MILKNVFAKKLVKKLALLNQTIAIEAENFYDYNGLKTAISSPKIGGNRQK